MCFRWYVICALSAISLHVQGDECARSLVRLEHTPEFKSVYEFLSQNPRAGMVNESNGSYVVIESKESAQLWITFYTSGLFDLYGVKDEGPLEFCQSPEGLVLVGLGHRELFRLDSMGRLGLEEGGPRKTFSVGEVPALLQRLHHIDARGIASER